MKRNHQLGTVFFVHHRRASAVKRIECLSDRISKLVLRDRWCNIVLNVHAPTEEKSDDSKYGIYKEFEQVFNHFTKYHITILLGNINVKLGREDIFKPTIGNETLHQDSKDNGVPPHQNMWLL
jgi:hypothetical protein